LHAKLTSFSDVPADAKCKHCHSRNNKQGAPEKLLGCSSCPQFAHPSCVGLNAELLAYVTSYDWECDECKNCAICKSHGDEDKMLFCDLCDRGYHIYCVGLEEIPSGSWFCRECTFCASCKVREDEGKEPIKWMTEYKTGANGGKIYSHSMCWSCHR